MPTRDGAACSSRRAGRRSSCSTTPTRSLLASRRARQSIDGIDEGEPIPEGLLSGDLGIVPLIVPYDVGWPAGAARLPEPAGRHDRVRGAARGLHGRRLPRAAHAARAAARHCSRRRRCRARTCTTLVDQARAEVESVRELIDEVLFLSELESGGRVVSLGSVPVRPELDAVACRARGAGRAGRRLACGGGRPGDRARDAAADAPRGRPEPGRERDPLRRARAPRSRSPSSASGDGVVLRGTDDGVGVNEDELLAPVRALLPRRPLARLARHRPRARDREAHRHQAGGTVEARGGTGAGLEIRCVFPRR